MKPLTPRPWRRPVPAVVLVLPLVGIFASGGLADVREAASAPADRGSILAAAARSLLPPGARVLRHAPGRCVELAPYPSCVTILFAHRQEPFRGRLRHAVANARSHGWNARVQSSRYGAMIWVERRKLWGFISIRPSDRNTCARGETLMRCSGHVGTLQVKSS